MKPFRLTPFRPARVGKDESFRRGIRALLLPKPQLVPQPFRQMHGAERLLGLAVVAQLAAVRRLGYGERPPIPIEATPPQCEQLAGAESFGHVQSQQNAVP